MNTSSKFIHRKHLGFCALIISIGSGIACAQNVLPPSDPEQEVTPKNEESTSLDELLGIGEPDGDPKDAPEVDAITESERKKIDDLLNERTLQENLDAAITDMKTAARMIDQSKSTGIEVQRIQVEIMSRLDAVIEEAIRQQQQQQQQQSSSSQQQQQQQDQQSEQSELPQQPDQSEQQQSEQANQQQAQGENSDQLPPGRQDAELQMMFEESDVEWGNLPERMRNILRQGLRESVSKMYQDLTESYYQRIAEDASE